MTCQPITQKSQIELMKSDLKKGSYRNYLMMVIQLNCGMRIGDTISLKVSDVKDKEYLEIIEEKTGKRKRFLINSQLRNEINEYIIGMDEDDYLFPSRQSNGQYGHITRIQAYRILKESATKVGIKNFSTHSLRKTFGFFYYEKTKDVGKLMQIFNHSSQQVTLIYIGRNQKEIDETLENFFL